MSDRLQILILSAEPPYPPTYGGARIRLFHLLQQLAPRYDFTLLTLLETPEDREFLPALEPYCRKILAFDYTPPATRPTLRERLRAPAYRLVDSPPMAAALVSELRDGHYDLVHADTPRMAIYTPLLRGQRKIIAATDSSTLAHRNQTALAKGLRAKARARYLQWLVTRYERDNYREYDAGVVVADRDAAVIRRLCPRLPVHVIPNGVNPDFLSIQPAENPSVDHNSEVGAVPPLQKHMKSDDFREGPRPRGPLRGDFSAESSFQPILTADVFQLVFTGTLDYEPNVDAVLWFTQQILPLIRRDILATQFHVIGRNPTPKIHELASQNPAVTVTGFVPDLRPALAAAAVYVCPLRLGAGLKNKVLEAMAMGLAIVTTTEGASGNAGRNGQHFMVADDPANFAAAVVKLLRDPQRREQLGAAARQLVSETYSWERAGEAFHKLYLEVARRKRETRDFTGGVGSW